MCRMDLVARPGIQLGVTSSGSLPNRSVQDPHYLGRGPGRAHTGNQSFVVQMVPDVLQPTTVGPHLGRMSDDVGHFLDRFAGPFYGKSEMMAPVLRK